MNLAIGLALLVGGIILLIFGIQESQSVAGEMSRVFTGSPTERSMWMIIGGAVASVVGLVLVVLGMRKA